MIFSYGHAPISYYERDVSTRDTHASAITHKFIYWSIIHIIVGSTDKSKNAFFRVWMLERSTIITSVGIMFDFIIHAWNTQVSTHIYLFILITHSSTRHWNSYETISFFFKFIWEESIIINQIHYLRNAHAR